MRFVSVKRKMYRGASPVSCWTDTSSKTTNFRDTRCIPWFLTEKSNLVVFISNTLCWKSTKKHEVPSINVKRTRGLPTKLWKTCVLLIFSRKWDILCNTCGKKKVFHFSFENRRSGERKYRKLRVFFFWTKLEVFLNRRFCDGSVKFSVCFHANEFIRVLSRVCVSLCWPFRAIEKTSTICCMFQFQLGGRCFPALFWIYLGSSQENFGKPVLQTFPSDTIGIF